MSKNRKKRQLINKRKRFIITNVFLVLFLLLGIGFSYLNVNTNILGNVLVKNLKTHTITYNLNGGTLATNNKSSFIRTDAEFTLNNPTREGYIFAGWTGTNLDERTLNVTIDPKKDIDYNLEANWKKEINNLKLYAGDHIGDYLELPITYDNYSLNDYLITLSSSYEITIYANISGNPQKVSFPTWVDGNSTPPLNNANYLSQPAIIDGREFNYYYISSENYRNEINTHFYMYRNLSQPIFFTEINKYELNNQKIIYNPNGGNTDFPTRLYNPGYTVDLSPDIATREGYTMLGWSDEEDGDIYTEYRMQYGKHFASDTNLYAQWSKTTND